MNRVYKVIWSKAKHCYVVTSEIARSVTKSASSARSAGRKGAAVLAMAALLFTAGGVLGEAANVTEIAVSDTGNVITATKDDKSTDVITINNVAHATEADHAKEADYALKATGDGNGEVIHKIYARKTDAKDNLKVGDDGVISKVTGNDGTTSSPVNKLVLNVDGNNPITMDENGIKVGKNSTVIASDGVFAGGDTADAAKAALNANGSIKGAAGDFEVDENGKVTAKGGVDTNGDINAGSGTVKGNTITGETVTDGKGASMSNGTVTGKTLTDGTATISNGNIKTNGGYIQTSGGNVNTQGGEVRTNSGKVATSGGEINTGSGAIKTVGGDILTAGGKLNTSGGNIVAGTGEISGQNIKASGVLSGDSLTVANGMTGRSLTLTGGDLDAGAGTIKTTGEVDAGTLNVSGKATVKDLEVKGEYKAETLTSKLDENNYTTINGGNVTSEVNDKVGAVEYTAESIFNKDGSSITARTDVGEHADSTGKSIVGAKEISQYLGDAALPDDSKKNVTRSMVRNGDTFYMEDKAEDKTVDGKNKYSTVSQNAGERTVTVTDGENTASTNLTAADIKNTAENGMISNTAKNLVNRASENMTNTVGGNLTTTVTGDSSLTAVNITNEVKNKITNKAIDVETDATSSIVQKVTNDYGSNTSTQLSYQTTEEMSQADGKTASYLRGAAEEKSQLIDGAKKTTIDTIAGQTNTNITDGTNTSNDLQKADQIASSVTDGTNTTVVNQDARSLASSITDGTGTKVNNSIHWVDGSAQRIEVDDTHFYAETRTAEKAEEALKSGNTVIDIVKDTNTATVSSAVTDGATITGISQNAKDISLSAAGGTIASGAKNISNTAAEKLSNSAADIENKASKSILNQVGENTSWKMMDGTVVESVKDASGKTNQTTTTAADTYQFVKDGDNTLAKRTSSTNDNLNITDGTNTYTKITTATGNKQTVTDGTETASTNLTKEASNTLIKNGTQSVLDHMAADTSYTVMNENGNGSRRQQTASEILDRVTDGTDTSEVKQTASEVAASAKNISNTATDKITSQIGDGSAVKSEMTAKGITNTAKDGTITNDAKDLVNTASNSITDKVGENVERTMGTKQIQDKVGKTTVTTTDGLTELTNKDRNHKTVMDYANVTKDLNVNGDATVDQKLTVKGDSDLQGNATVGKNLEVKGTSTLTGNVTMESDATVEKDLTVKGASEFVGRADFRNDVYVDNNLFVTGETRTDTLYVDHDGYVDGDLYVAGNIETHDAVLSADSRQVVTGRQLYQTNERVDRLDNRIKKVGANAAALAALRPGDFNPDDKFSIAAGFGSYRNANAAALGLFYRPNENVLLSLGTSFGDGENMVNAGVSVKFGRGKSMAERRKEMADEVSSMRDEMRSQDERIAELEEMLKKQSELIEKLSKES